MSLAYKIQNFLKQKLKENNLTRKDFAINTGLNYSSVCDLINAAVLNPELKTLLKIVNYFNCSMDEVIGKTKYIEPKKTRFNNISSEEMNINLKKFIKKRLEEHSLNYYKLSKNQEFSKNSIRHFISENGSQKTLGTAVTITLADYFKVSIDEMIGRISPSNQEPPQPPEIIKSKPEDIKTN